MPATVLLCGALLVAAALALSPAAARAGADVGVGLGIHGDGMDVSISAGTHVHPEVPLAPAPRGGLRVDLWSDPDAGSVVRPGQNARLSWRANADCYVTLLSVDTEGRVRMLYPGLFDDGWVEGGRTYRLPRRRDAVELIFTGPPGMEYVYAVASLYPMRHRFPQWMVTGRVEDLDDFEDEADPYETGWIIGDPFFQIRAFCRDLVAYPGEYDSYATSYLFFHVGRRVAYPRTVCADCHAPGWVDPYGPVCPAVRLRVGQIRCSGWIDFRLVFDPCYRYEVWTGWRPRHWRGSRWSGPGGRWVWSSADGHREIARKFRDARFRDGGGKGNLRVPEGIPGHSGGDRIVPRDPAGGARVRERTPAPQPERSAWHRALEERLDRSIGERRGGEPKGAPAPGDPSTRNLRGRGKTEEGGNGRSAPGVERRDRGSRSDPPQKSSAERSEPRKASQGKGAPEKPSRSERKADRGDRGSERGTPARRSR